MTLQLNFTQRMQLVSMIDGRRWDQPDLRHIYDLAKEIEPSDEERKAANVRVVGNGAGIQWDRLSDETAPFEASRKQVDLVAKMLAEGKYSRGDVEWLEPLMEQLK